MPKRSNPFQQVVKLLHDQFSDGGVVTESKQLPDSRTGKLCEVDIVIETTVADYPVVISVECIDHKRPATVEWVREMWAKHSDLPTNKLILVSRSGFSQEAAKKAQALDITTLALDEAKATDWTRIAGKLSEIGVEWLESKYEGFALAQSAEGIQVLPLPRDLLLHDTAQSTFLHVGSLIDRIIKLPEVGAVFLDHMSKENKKDNVFTVEHEFPEPMLCQGPKGEELTVRGLRLVFSAMRGRTSVPLFHGAMRGAEVAFGESAVESGQLRIAVVEQIGRKPVLDIRKKDGPNWRSLVNADTNTPSLVRKDENTT